MFVITQKRCSDDVQVCMYVCILMYVGSSPHRVGGSWFLLHRDLIPLMHYLFYSELRACLGRFAC